MFGQHQRRPHFHLGYSTEAEAPTADIAPSFGRYYCTANRSRQIGRQITICLAISPVTSWSYPVDLGD